MHTVVKNSNYSYKLMWSELIVTGEERDLEVMINNSMKMLSQYASIVKKERKKKRHQQCLGLSETITENSQYHDSPV